MIYSLQLLRFFAASLVVLNHVRNEFGLPQFGVFGVDIFFIISGFIIYFSTIKTADGFLLRRLIRIVPLYWLFTAFVSLLAFFAPELLKSTKFDISHIVSSLVFFPHWTPSTGFQPMLTLGWTLNCEMFFYLLFFVSMKISYKYRDFVCTAFLLATVTASSYFAPDRADSVLIFYSNPILLEFCLGMLAGRLFSLRKKLFTDANYMWFALLLVSAVSMTLIGSKEMHPMADTSFRRFVDFGIPSFALVLSFLASERFFGRFVGFFKRLCNTAGDISYSMYLSHIYIVAVCFRVADLKSVDISVLFLIIMIVSSIASWCVFMLYEHPSKIFLSKRLMGKKNKTGSLLR